VRPQLFGLGDQCGQQSLDEPLRRFAERRLAEPFPYLILDARHEKVRKEGVIGGQAFLIGGGRRRGRRRIGQPRKPVELPGFPVGSERARLL
jgi:hypothetical protein